MGKGRAITAKNGGGSIARQDHIGMHGVQAA